MRRAFVATSGISALVVVLLALKPHQLPTVTGSAPAVSSSPRTTTDPSGNPSPSGTSGSSSGGSTGTYTGDAVDTRYGAVQVAVTLSKGRLTAVKVLQVPSENGRDQQIASYSVPVLTQEAIAAQSARIDAVSGATYTSQGYIQSLQSALDQAGA